MSVEIVSDNTLEFILRNHLHIHVKARIPNAFNYYRRQADGWVQLSLEKVVPEIPFSIPIQKMSHSRNVEFDSPNQSYATELAADHKSVV